MVRSADRLEAEPVPGITGARSPFFSPDGRWVGFFEGAELKKVAVTGGPAISLTRHSGTPRGGSWGPDGTIVFATNSAPAGLLSVSADGGEAVVLTRPDASRGEVDHFFPWVLPNGRGVIFTALRAGPELQLMSLDLRTRQQKVLIRGASGAEYVPTGHLVYALGGRLNAVAFDPERLEIVGEPVVLNEPVIVLPTGAAEFSVSRTGTLVYIPGAANGSAVVTRTLVWVDRKGREEPLGAAPRAYSVPRLSPDDRQVALISAEADLDLWMWDIARRTLRRLTVDARQDAMPAWTPDGQRVIFSSAQFGAPNVFWLRANGAGRPERLTTSPNIQFPMAISPDGKLGVVLEQSASAGNNDLMLLHIPDPSGMVADGKAKVEPLLATMFNETNASISPDGRFLAYQSNEGGQTQVYVRPFPNVNDGIWPISTNGGRFALWARNGKELFYAELDGSIMTVPVQTTPTFSAGSATKLFQWPTLDLPSPARNYDVTRDGQKFLMIKEPDGSGSDAARASTSSIVMVVNWIETLKEKR
jgi:serine/threonine-protein kinase